MRLDGGMPIGMEGSDPKCRAVKCRAANTTQELANGDHYQHIVKTDDHQTFYLAAGPQSGPPLMLCRRHGAG